MPTVSKVKEPRWSVGDEHRAPARPLLDEPLGERLGEVAGGEGVDADGQVRAVLLERAHREHDHGALARQRVQRRARQLLEEVNAQKLLPRVAAR